MAEAKDHKDFIFFETMFYDKIGSVHFVCVSIKKKIFRILQTFSTHTLELAQYIGHAHLHTLNLQADPMLQLRMVVGY
jgi:hypothetical protein